MILSSKIEARHQQLQAIIYVRQSTPKQVQINQESTRRQYQLVERARQMGWPASQIRVIDEDLGLSGASSRQRTGFQKLVAAIGLGEVGIILVTEVSASGQPSTGSGNCAWSVPATRWRWRNANTTRSTRTTAW